jgi:outer membrane immunogenic protein
MLRRILLASAGAVAIAGSAVAADLPSRAPPPIYLPPPVFTWTGLYLGGQIGYSWASDPADVVFFTPPPPPEDPFLNLQGVIGGAHVGYNLQINQWVVGLEGSVDGTGLSSSAFDPGSGLTVGARSDVQGSIRARAGFAFDRVLLYATGGVAFAGINDHYTDVSGLVTGVPGTAEGISRTRAGWTVGGGLEYAVTNNWLIGVEYRYSDFGHYTDVPFAAFIPAETTLSVQHHLTENQVQARLSYKFDTWAPAPVVAKY